MNYKTITLQLGEQEREVEVAYDVVFGDVEICQLFDVKTKLMIAEDLVGSCLVSILEDEIIRKLGLEK